MALPRKADIARPHAAWITWLNLKEKLVGLKNGASISIGGAASNDNVTQAGGNNASAKALAVMEFSLRRMLEHDLQCGFSLKPSETLPVYLRHLGFPQVKHNLETVLRCQAEGVVKEQDVVLPNRKISGYQPCPSKT